MKIAHFKVNGTTAYGIVDGKKVKAICGLPWDGLAPTGEAFNLAEVTLLAPVDPPNLFAIGLNYKAHAAESGAAPPREPVIFIKANTSVIGPDGVIRLPKMAPNEVDYEAELAIVIGKTCSDVSEEEALDYVFGYTCGNDVSARDCQIRLDKQWARGKSFNTFCPLGPWIETEIDGDNVEIKSVLNGQIMQSSSTSDMIFSCRQLISFLSQVAVLKPGTVIMTGTPSGVGVARTPPVFLRNGDTIEIVLSGIGSLVNTVASQGHVTCECS